jgi:hypothetical protein
MSTRLFLESGPSQLGRISVCRRVTVPDVACGDSVVGCGDPTTPDRRVRSAERGENLVRIEILLEISFDS